VIERHLLLQRASALLRSTPEPGWSALRVRLRAAVQAAPRGAWPLCTDTGSGTTAGAVYISDHVLRAILARELRRRHSCQPTTIDFTRKGTALQAVRITMTGTYRTALHPLGDAVRATVIGLIHDMLDSPENSDSAPLRPVEVTFTDIVAEDPLHP
jgi:hypothetical protein